MWSYPSDVPIEEPLLIPTTLVDGLLPLMAGNGESVRLIFFTDHYDVSGLIARRRIVSARLAITRRGYNQMREIMRQFERGDPHGFTGL